MEHIALGWLFFFLLVLVACSAFFSGSEIGVMSINRYRLRHLVKQEDRRALRISRLLERPDRLLGVILIGNTFANIVASSLATLVAVRLWGEIGIAIGTISLTVVILIFAEIMPKTVAAFNPQKVAFLTSLPLKYLLMILSPVVWLTSSTANSLLKLFGVDLSKRRGEQLSGEELRTVVMEASALLPTERKNMLLGVFDLEQVTVDDIMVPRQEIIGIDLNDPWEEIIEQLRLSQHTRLPLYRDSIDKIIGFLHVRSVMSLSLDEKLDEQTLMSAAESTYFIPEGTPLNTLLINMRTTKCRSALVVDEYGDIQGLATLEDILEEIVGEFTTDLATASKDVHPQDDGTFLVDGSAPLRELTRSCKWHFPKSDAKTLSGFVIEYLEFIPPVGTCIRVNNLVIEVVHTKGNLLKTLKIYSR